jgi:hypothetical protein
MEYLTLRKRRDALLEELDRLREANQRATSRLTATRLSGTGGHASFADGAIRVVDGEASLRHIIEHIDECLDARLAVIEQLPDERQKLVLTYRYINGCGWDEIMNVMHYQERQVFEHHGRALFEIMRLLKVRSKTQ